VSPSIPLVGIGASAGGLEALGSLLEALPARLGASLIVVSHLDRSHESLLPEILARKTQLRVLEAREGVAPVADHIYVISPNVTLTVVDGRIHLAPRAEGRRPHMPVNALFESLARERGVGAVGVVLSGADSDGSIGIQAIKNAGGITFAQTPDTAGVPSMPQNAIETGCVDFVLPPRLIANELVRLAAHPYLRPVSNDLTEREDATVSTGAEDPSLRRIFRRLRSAHGVDFTRYKPATLRRRLARRMALQKIDDLDDYVGFLESDSAEAASLYHDFLIRVTGFFRDPEVFKALAEEVLPDLCAGRSQKEPIRIWVPGCATGEEVYSIAIALVEFLGEHALSIGIQIFGTDVSESAIEKARAGSYLDSIAQDVSAERLNRFFVKENAHYIIARNIRDLCVFARQDVTRDPPFSRLDLVSCRNLLIYLGAASQQRVMQIFHYALRKRGLLMLGPSESVGHASELFELTDKTHRFYKPKLSSGGTSLELQRSLGGLSAERESTNSVDGSEANFIEMDSALRQADRWFLARYAPAGILVDEALNILQFRGETGPYLAPASGPPSMNLARVVRPELLVDMVPALEEARANGKIARRPSLSVEGLGAVDLEVIPLPRAGVAPCYLFVFEDESRRAASRRDRQAQIVQLPDSEIHTRNARLERENADLREFLQATMEQHEAAKEELRSAHEEVLSANEEFQSTNEELETSKEELQSGNEELTTTNEELRDRNRQLGLLNTELDKARRIADRARAYADGIVETVREPLLVLDAELRILRANAAFHTVFNLRPEVAENRLFCEIGDEQWNTTRLREQLTLVLSRGEPMVDLELPFTQKGLGHRLLCLNARRISGDSERAALILLSIEDVTEPHAKAESLREGSRRKDEFLAMLAHELRNPLGPITHAVHLLKRGSPDAPRLYEMLERQTARLVRLVDELLDVARISRGLIELKREPVDLVPIVRSAVEASRPRLEQREHTLSLSLAEKLLCVDGDAVRLEQVISNLIENAIKYTNPGGHLSVSLTEAGGDAVLSVADSGIGLESDSLERIFDLFTQVDSSLARSGGGLGLGLTLVRRVLEMHSGRIEAHSAGLGKGSEFVVRIPLLPTTPLREGNVPTQSSESTRVLRRVLIVDDNVDSAESVAMLIRSWGHEAYVAHTAMSALELAERFAPESALLDIGLPDMDGYALARRLRAQDTSGNLQLVAMTGYGRAEDRTAARDAGFDVHLVKPAEPDELAGVLAKGK
jgi:two-component system, chemotaxis family, CheB/CheR fusion protein